MPELDDNSGVTADRDGNYGAPGQSGKYQKPSVHCRHNVHGMGSIAGATGASKTPYDLLEAFFFVNSLEAIPRHVARNMRTVERFLEARQIRNIADINNESIQDYCVELVGRGLKPHTLRNTVSSISRFCRFLIRRGLLKSNPCQGIAMPPSEENPPLFLNAIECEKALRIARNHGIHCEVCLALNTGLRMSELRFLEWRDVDFDRRILLVRRTKSRRSRTVPLNSTILPVLREQYVKTGMYPHVFPGGRRRLDGKPGKGPWDPTKPRGERWWLQAMRPLQNGVPTFQLMPKGSIGRGWHLLRHTFASRLARRGVSLFKIGKWLGHRHVSTTMMYAHLSADYDEDIEKA